MRVVIAGGGTGGHLFPGVAVAEELVARGHEVLFVGTARGIEARVVPSLGWRLELIEIGGVKGLGAGGAVRAGLRMPSALWRSRAILREFGADVVVGVGGYASGPVLLAAALGGRATAILEQNSIPGITNRALGKVVRRVFTSFDESHRFFPPGKIVRAGNPIRARLREEAARPAALHKTNAAPHNGAGEPAPLLLVCGGSQGARAVNQVVGEALALLAAEGRAPRVLHQTGKSDRDAVEERYRAAGVQAEVREFIDDMAAAYRDADLVVCRAGATTLAELTAFGRAAVLVPFPHATDDHQIVNARALVEGGAARLVVEREATARGVADLIAGLLADPAGRAAMAAASRALGRPEAASAIVDDLLAMGASS